MCDFYRYRYATPVVVKLRPEKISDSNGIYEAVCVRTDKTNFGFSPISLIFSMNIDHYIP